MRPHAPRSLPTPPAAPFVSTWQDLPRTIERRVSRGPGPRTAFMLATYGVVLLSVVVPLT